MPRARCPPLSCARANRRGTNRSDCAPSSAASRSTGTASASAGSWARTRVAETRSGSSEVSLASNVVGESLGLRRRRLHGLRRGGHGGAGRRVLGPAPVAVRSRQACGSSGRRRHRRSPGRLEARLHRSHHGRDRRGAKRPRRSHAAACRRAACRPLPRHPQAFRPASGPRAGRRRRGRWRPALRHRSATGRGLGTEPIGSLARLSAGREGERGAPAPRGARGMVLAETTT